MHSNVVHVQDDSGRRSLCGVALPEECPTYSVPEEKLVDCGTCAGLELRYEGSVFTGYYPIVVRKER